VADYAAWFSVLIFFPERRCFQFFKKNEKRTSLMSNDIEIKKNMVKEELEKLKYEFKVEIPKRISEARAYGDLRENAEYDAARERQAFVKARITQLSVQLSKLNDIDISKLKADKIGYGSQVTLVDEESGRRMELTIVSSEEVNTSEGKISLASPIGLALNDHTAGETVDVDIPAGKRRFYIEKITTIHGEEIESKRD
jgi:transcription elongation factor GreA